MKPRIYEESDRLALRALQWTPGGSQTASKAPGRAGPYLGYPAILKSSYGAWCRDVDLNDYLDFIAGLAAVGLGHSDARVVDAVQRQMMLGSIMSLPTRLEADVAEQLCEITGWAEQARFVKTGSEATEAAIRVARCATGRYGILTVESGYHSWHSWFQAVKENHPGVPSDYCDLIYGLPYGDREAWDQQLQSRIYACVILEPAPINGGGDAEFLRWLVERAHACGTLVVFDEIVWGFRYATAGFGVAHGVTPDLATYGKAMGNGVPIAALVGKRDVMQHATVVSGTYGGDLLGLAAARAVMHAYQHDEQESVTSRMWSLGSHFKVTINEMLADPKVAVLGASCSGYPVHPVIKFSQPDYVMSLFVQELADRGVLWHPAGGNIIAAMPTDALDEHLDKAFLVAFLTVAEAVEDASVAARLRGQPHRTAFARAR